MPERSAPKNTARQSCDAVNRAATVPARPARCSSHAPAPRAWTPSSCSVSGREPSDRQWTRARCARGISSASVTRPMPGRQYRLGVPNRAEPGRTGPNRSDRQQRRRVPSSPATGGQDATRHPCAAVHVAGRPRSHRADVHRLGEDGRGNRGANALSDGPLVPDGDDVARRGADARGIHDALVCRSQDRAAAFPAPCGRRDVPSPGIAGEDGYHT